MVFAPVAENLLRRAIPIVSPVRPTSVIGLGRPTNANARLFLIITGSSANVVERRKRLFLCSII